MYLPYLLSYRIAYPAIFRYASQTFSTGAVYQMRIAHFEGFFADDTHGCTIRDMEIALDTVDLKAERSAYCAV